MSSAQLERLRQVDAEQVRLFREFMASPEKRDGIIEWLAALKREERQLTGEELYVPPVPVRYKHRSGRMSNPARAAHFRKDGA